jgi:hypothetical protein
MPIPISDCDDTTLQGYTRLRMNKRCTGTTHPAPATRANATNRSAIRRSAISREAAAAR